jgi:hypothetical protein
MLVKLRLITAILDPKINDLFRRLCICEVESWRRVEFNILRGDTFTGRKEVAVDVEDLIVRISEHSLEHLVSTDLDGEASRLRNTILTYLNVCVQRRVEVRDSHQALDRQAPKNSDISLAIHVLLQTCSALGAVGGSSRLQAFL